MFGSKSGHDREVGRRRREKQVSQGAAGVKLLTSAIRDTAVRASRMTNYNTVVQSCETGPELHELAPQVPKRCYCQEKGDQVAVAPVCGHVR